MGERATRSKLLEHALKQVKRAVARPGSKRGQFRLGQTMANMIRPSAASAFARAQTAFAAGDFDAAAAYARAAEAYILDQTVVEKRGREGSPRYSIIILAQRHSADLENLIGQVKPYLSDDFELVLVLNGFSAGKSAQLPDAVTVVQVGFNYGCAGGRNLGARLARGKFLIFLDDDGVLGEGAIDRLIDVIQRYDAVAVRGRILPRTEGALTPRHYDYGDEITYSAPDTEGLSIWRREEFLHFGGFDSLLAGHEGIALWSKMFRFYGPDSFLYAPRAVLHHDYAKTESHRAEKKRQRTFNLAYLEHAYPTAVALKSTIHKLRDDTRTRILFARSRYTVRNFAPELPLARPRVSVLTVAKNAGSLLDDYTQSLKRQIFPDFEVIFVDQGSTDGTADRLAALWEGDARLRLLKSGGGRAESFNLALAEAAHDICVIAEAGDISLPKRLELTVRHFSTDSSSCLSFAKFSENDLFMGAKAPAPVRLRTRSLLEPASFFGSLSFRKTHFSIPLDASLANGCESRWLLDNLVRASADGTVIPLHQVFHGRADAMTDAERQADRDADLAALHAAHEQLLGEMSQKDRWCCRVLSGREELAIDSIPILKEYTFRLITENAEKGLYDQIEIEEGLAARLAQLERQRERMRGDRYRQRLKTLRRKYEGEPDDLKGVPEKD